MGKREFSISICLSVAYVILTLSLDRTYKEVVDHWKPILKRASKL